MIFIDAASQILEPGVLLTQTGSHHDWHGAIPNALKEGQKRGRVLPDIDGDDTATFLIAAYEGHMSLAKNSEESPMLQSGKKSMVRFLRTLRTSDVVKGSAKLN